MRKLAGILAIMLLAICLPMMVSAANIGTDDTVVYLDATFSTDSLNGWANGGVGEWTISNGTANYTNTKTSQSFFQKSLEDEGADIYASGKPFMLYYKHKIGAGYGGFNLAIQANGTGKYMTWGPSASSSTYGKWAEVYMFIQHDMSAATTYIRWEDQTNWSLFDNSDNNRFLRDNSIAPQINFYNSVTVGDNGAIDDVRIFQGPLLSLSDPTVVGTDVKINGIYFSGGATSVAPEHQNMSWIAIATDKELGYVTKLAQGAMPTLTTATTPQSCGATLSLAGIDPAQNNISVLTWDSVSSAKPVADVVGAPIPNEANQEWGLDASMTEHIDTAVSYNVINLDGFVGANETLTATLYKNDTLCAATQIEAGANGLVKGKIGVNPSTCATGEYTLNLRYGDTVVPAQTVDLLCDDLPYNTITSKETFISFLNTYGSDAEKAMAANDEEVTKAYATYQQKGVTDFYGFAAAMAEIDATYQKNMNILNVINTAVAANRWGDLQVALTTTYKEELQIDTNKLMGINDHRALFMAMCQNPFTTLSGVTAAYDAAYLAQYNIELLAAQQNNSRPTYNPGYNPGPATGGFGNGGSVSVSDSNKEEEEPAEQLPPLVESPQFQDLETVPWAEEEILALQGMGVVNGEGDGNFYPDRTVTREEFLKMILQAAGISADGNAEENFADVDSDDWYYNYVATANKLGIVNGVSETAFGVGAQITRADMAVMLYRVIQHKGKELDPVKPAFIFADFDKIPDYAEKSISALCEADLMNGVGDNRFAPADNATRAEAAVAIYRIYNYINK